MCCLVSSVQYKGINDGDIYLNFHAVKTHIAIIQSHLVHIVQIVVQPVNRF